VNQAAIQRSSTEVRKMQVTFTNCDCTKNDINIFSAANPHGTWRLNLAEPYGYVAFNTISFACSTLYF
jgi:hypothetical protein